MAVTADNKIKIDTKFFAQKWQQFNDMDKGESENLTPENNWNELHDSWRKFVLWMFPRLAEFEFGAKKEKLNAWMVTDKKFETDDMKFEELSSKCFNKVRSIQRQLGKREGNDWALVFRKDKAGKVTTRIDWEESTLPEPPIGMECKAKNPPKRGRSSSSVWEDIESIFE